jgi:hypothetical protein
MLSKLRRNFEYDKFGGIEWRSSQLILFSFLLKLSVGKSIPNDVATLFAPDLGRFETFQISKLNPQNSAPVTVHHLGERL